MLLSRPECESIIDEGGDGPDDKEGKGDWKDTWVEAVEDGEPQNVKLSGEQLECGNTSHWLHSPPPSQSQC